MKQARQNEIIALVRQQPVGNQDELMLLLKEKGFPVTQATISRDIRELKLVKRADAEGNYCYCLPELPAQEEMLIGNVLSVDHAGNTVVIKCRSGTAQAVCTVLDNMLRPEVVGTLAGDDTIFVLVRTGRQAENFTAELKLKLRNG